MIKYTLLHDGDGDDMSIIPYTLPSGTELYLACDVAEELWQGALAVERKDTRIAELEKALREAIEGIENWATYSSDYFREKHDLEGELKRLRSVL